MFFYLSKLLPPLLLYPPGVTMILLIVAALLWKRRRHLATGLAVFALAHMYLMSIDPVVGALQRPLETWYPALTVDAAPKSDAVVVLGGYLRPPSGSHKQAELTEASDRLLVALELFKAGKAPIVLLTGGNPTMLVKGRPEAQAARALLLELGVPAEAIVIEDQSVNTRENAQFSGPILAAHGARKLLLVTSALHMPRAVAIFKRAGIDVVPFPTDYQSGWSQPDLIFQWLPEADNISQANKALKEWVGLQVYRLRGWA
jgi:uncharacterized SAM-binding protein YcdF (DUF218 family)